jgi:translation initiation factor 1
MPDENSRLVYSTGGGRVPTPRPPAANRVSPRRPRTNPIPDDGVVRVHRAKNAKGGKTMTAVSGLPGSEADLDAALKRLKTLLGVGGSREGRTLLLQGDQRERLMRELATMGHRPKLAGG